MLRAFVRRIKRDDLRPEVGGIDVFCAGVDKEKQCLSGKNGGAWGLSEFLLIGDTGIWLRLSKTFIAGKYAISYGENR